MPAGPPDPTAWPARALLPWGDQLVPRIVGTVTGASSEPDALTAVDPLDDDRRTALRRAAIRANLAPSFEDSQPWRLRLRTGELDILGDGDRWRPFLDPDGRGLAMSIGAALMNARCALHSAQESHLVERPTPASFNDRYAVVRVEPGKDLAWDEVLAGLDEMTTQLRLPDDASRRTGGPSPSLMQALQRAAAEEECTVSSQPPAGYALSTALLVSAAGDGPTNWVRVGEALQRMRLQAAATGWGAAVEAPADPAEMSGAVLRLGPAGRSAITRHRPLAVVLAEEPS